MLDCIKALCFYHSLCLCLKLDRIKEEASKVKDNCRSPWCTRFVEVTNEHDDDLATLLMKINVVFSSLPLLIGDRIPTLGEHYSLSSYTFGIFQKVLSP